MGRLRRLELGLVRVRWFGAAFAAFQVLMVLRADEPVPAPGHVAPAGFATSLVLVATNLAARWWLSGDRSER